MASTKIHGINIKIGADTTGVGQAFSEINKSISSLQGELRSVDKLLKLDPSNTTLLAQKQKLLADAINQTKSKLEALNKAYEIGINDDKVDKQAKSWRDLERDIASTTNKLNEFQKQQDSLNVGTGIDDISDSFNNASKSASIFSDVLSADLVATGIKALVSGIGTAISTIDSFVDNFNEMQAVETKFVTNIKNTTDATDKQIQAYLELAQAKEKNGVITKQAILEGSQELATYVESIDAIKMLTDVMLDMSAQQYGVNASASQVMGIGTTLGKALANGDYSGLTRLGYGFDELQQKIMETGTELEKAQVIVDVVSASVGGMNKALAQTSAGKQQQLNVQLEAIKQNIGEVGAFYKSKLYDVASPIILSLTEESQNLTDTLTSGLGEETAYIRDLNDALLESVSATNELYNQKMLNYDLGIQEAEILDSYIEKYKDANMTEDEAYWYKTRLKDGVDALNEALGQTYYLFDEENNVITDANGKVVDLTESYKNLAEATRQSLWIETHKEEYLQALSDIDQAEQKRQEALDKYVAKQREISEKGFIDDSDAYELGILTDNINTSTEQLGKLKESTDKVITGFETLSNVDSSKFDETLQNYKNGFGAISDLSETELPLLEEKIQSTYNALQRIKEDSSITDETKKVLTEDLQEELDGYQSIYNDLCGSLYEVTEETSDKIEDKTTTAFKNTKDNIDKTINGEDGVKSTLLSFATWWQGINLDKTIKITVDASAVQGYTSNAYSGGGGSGGFGINSGGFGVTLHNTINVNNNGKSITKTDVNEWGKNILDVIDRGLGQRV